MNNKKFKAYKCFSVPQKNFLISNGLEYITVATDTRSGSTFWLFLRCNELDIALNQWSNNKPKKI